MDKEFESIEDLLPKGRTKSEAELTKSIDDGFSKIPESDRSSAKFQTGLKLLFKWFANCGKGERELKELFTWFSNKKPQLFLETIPDYDRDKVLAIAQSGKLSTLSVLAESDITSDDLTTITDNVDQVLQLAKVVENVEGGMAQLLKYAELIKQEDEDFKFKLKIGELVEKVFGDALNSAGLNSEFCKVSYIGKGAHDFEIHHTVLNKKFFIELKSFQSANTPVLKLAPSQAKEALVNPENYCLAIMERPSELQDITEKYITENLISKLRIGDIVEMGLKDFDVLDGIKKNNQLHLTFRDPIRINIDKNIVTNSGLNFSQLIGIIKDYLK